MIPIFLNIAQWMVSEDLQVMTTAANLLYTTANVVLT
jgi:hypothetical protein